MTTPQDNQFMLAQLLQADDLLDALQQALNGVHVLIETQVRMAANAKI